MKNLVAFLALFWISISCHAFSCDKPITGLHMNTYHFDRNANYKEDNLGQYFRCENGFTAGSYKNSDWKHSDYVGYSFGWKNFEVMLGAVAGYKIEPMPVIIPSVKLPYLPLRVAYLPQAPNNKNNTQGLHVMLELNLK